MNNEVRFNKNLELGAISQPSLQPSPHPARFSTIVFAILWVLAFTLIAQAAKF